MEESLDPRINRLPGTGEWKQAYEKDSLDQFPTFEVFVQAKEDKPFQHEGVVHAPEPNFAFLFAKEQFSRRYSCSGIWVVNTQNVFVSDYTENSQNIYDNIDLEPEKGPLLPYEVFHLMRRGKQHKHMGMVNASGLNHALMKAKAKFDIGKPVLNVWVAKSSDIFQTNEEHKAIWDTLPLKQFREATDYKGGEKIREFKAKQKE